jgi:aminoglycoside 3-N-acetyltransferase I
MHLFGEVFEEKDTYQKDTPDEKYIQKFLSDDAHIVLVALEDTVVVGGLVAYELKKFEQARSEIFIYDLAIYSSHQRHGIGTDLLSTLKQIAQQKKAYTIFVQADKEDEGAVSFYRTLNSSEVEGFVFDLEIEK